MEVDIARASAAVVQHVPPAAVEEFNKWQRGVREVVEHFPGYLGTDLYPPADERSDEWVTVIHFEDDQALQAWLNSSVRAEWVKKLRANVGEFELRSLSGGFSQWFSSVNRAAKRPTPAWKMVVTVVCALYPTVMLLNIFVAPHISRFGLAVSMLIGNILSVSILQWIVMPALTRILAPWLEANEGRRNAVFSRCGFAVIALILGSLALLFRQVTG